MMFRGRALAAALMLLTAACAPAQTAEQADAFVHNVYAHYERWAAEKSTSSGQSFKEAALYSPALIDLMRKDQKAADGEVGFIDYDPVCNCQDFDGLKVAEMHIAKTGEKTASGTVSLKFGGEPRLVKLQLMLVWTANGWRIDDIKTSDTPSLQAALKQSTRELLKLKASAPAGSNHPSH